MSKHTTEAMTTALRGLDPAPKTDLTEAERQHADATLASILATPSQDSVPAEHDRPGRRWSRMLVPIGLMGAAGAAVPALLLGGSSAFASWTPTPKPLSSAETSAAAATCLADLGMPASGEATLVAERRGTWTYVLMSEPKAEVTCLMRNDLVGQDPAGQEVFGSHDTDPGKAPTVARDRIVETGSTAAGIDDGWVGEEWLTWTYGYVGSEVTGVTVRTPLGFDVEASVDHGRFAAWWPSDKPSSENPEVMEAWSYTVTLADGNTRHTQG